MKKENAVLNNEMRNMENIETSSEQAKAMVLSVAYAVSSDGINSDETANALFGIAEIMERFVGDLSQSLDRLNKEYFPLDMDGAAQNG